MKKIVILPLIALAAALCSCDFAILPFSSRNSGSSSSTSRSIPSISISIADSGEGYYRPAKVNDQVDYHRLGEHNGDLTLPSTGNPKVLVLPIEFSGDTFTESRLQDIHTAIDGTPEETKYWHSLKSYYQTSSYGKLNMEFVFADVYNVGLSPTKWVDNYRHQSFTYLSGDTMTYADYIESLPQVAMEGAVQQFKDRGGDTTELDQDGDGLIDACIMIYSCRDLKHNPVLSLSKYGDLFWAYQFSDIRDIQGNVESPIGCRYFWASYDFFYEGVDEGKGVDAHTLIHEMGHILGADDYYNYGDDSTMKAEPSGGLMMMSYNIADHDIFTKLAYGWVTPYVVTGDCTLTLRPSYSSGDCILLADNWNGTCFDEFVILELYTPDGLNELDATIPYNSTRAFSKAGIRIFHVDSRLVYGSSFDDYDNILEADGYLSDEEIADFAMTSEVMTHDGKYIGVAATNSAALDATNIQGKGFDLIQIIQARGTNLTRFGDLSTNADLFQTGDVFSLSSYSAFFPRKSTLNNGEKLPYKVTFEEVNDGYATVKIETISA